MRSFTKWTSGTLLATCVFGVIVVACGGDDKKVTYPQGDAAAGTPVTNQQGGQVGVIDGAGTSGLTGAAKADYDAGWQAWLSGDLATAKAKFVQAASDDSKSPSPPYSLGVVYEHLGQLSSAQSSYKTAFSNDPTHELSMCAYALSLANAGKTGDADSFLTDKRTKRPNSARLTSCNAEVKSIAGDHGSAQQMAQDALRMDPDFKDAMVTIARDNYRARKMDLAKYALQAILDGFGDSSTARDKDNAEANLIRALIDRESGARASALKEFDAAVKKRPDLVEALVNLGSMRLEAGNAADAQAPLESAVKFAPTSALAHLNLGDCYRLLGKYPEAKKEFDAALAQDSSLAAVHYDMGLMYLTAPNIAGTSADQQVSTAIKELNQYKTMRGAKPAAGVQDDIDDLINRANAKQAELKNTANPPAAAAAPAAPAGSAKPASSGGIVRDLPK